VANLVFRKILERASGVFTFSGTAAENVLFSINKVTVDGVVW
jgi:threonine aldolase